jgi:1,4-alpha-glucan branching enzyme
MSKRSDASISRPAQGNRQPMSRIYSRDKTRCAVTFTLPKEAAPDSRTVAVAGSFNDWSADRNPMKRARDGSYSLQLDLEAGKTYEFRFVIDGVRWENAWNADKYVWNDGAKCENSVVIT